MEFRKATEVETVAREVMSENHALLDQRGPHVEWIMMKPSTPAASVPDWKMRKIQGANAYLALTEKPVRFGEDPYPTPFIAVEVSERYWERLDEDQREGFLGHVLSWLSYDYEKGKWTIEGPEFGEFSEVLGRRGFWRPGHRFQRFAETVSEQLSLLPETSPEMDEEPDEEPDENLDIALLLQDLRAVGRRHSARGQQYRGFRKEIGDGAGSANAASDLLESHGGLREALKATHPDRGGEPEEFRRVQEAREVLGL